MIRRPLRRRRPAAPGLEVLEARQLLTVATVKVAATEPDAYWPPAWQSRAGDPGEIDLTISGAFLANVSYTLSGNFSAPGQPDCRYVVHQDSPNSTTDLPASGVLGSLPGGTTKLFVVPDAGQSRTADEHVTLTITGVSNLCGATSAQVEAPGRATVTIHGRPQPLVSTSCPPGLLAGTASPGTGVAAPPIQAITGVRYATGGVSPQTPEMLSSGGYGGPPTGVALGWTNLAGYAGTSNGTNSTAGNGVGSTANVSTVSPFGEGMVDAGLPYLESTGSGGGLAAVTGAGNAVFFDYNGTPGSYSPRSFSRDTLTGGTGGYTLSQADGSVLTFAGFGANDLQQGRLTSYADPKGNLTTYNADSAGRPTSIVRTDGSTTGTYAYTYVGGTGINAGLASKVELKRAVGGVTSTVQQVAFGYYDGTQAYGNARDLATATLQDAAGVAIGTTYYRYYTDADVLAGAPGYVGGLKYQLNPRSYARLVAYVTTLPGGVTPATATDAQVAPYADQYYEYDSAHRVTATTVQGAGCSCAGSTGQGTYTYAYADNAAPGTGSNAWVRRTVETRPDGNQNLVYTNAAGEVMVSAFSDISDAGNAALNGKLWVTAYRYDAAGRLVLTAQPSAVTITTTSGLGSAAGTYSDIVGYNAGAGTYANLSSNSGRIDLVDYGAGTTATATAAGDVAGYFRADKVQNGYAGTPILTDGMQYVSHTDAGGLTVYPQATATAYRNADGTGAEVTTYAYTWYAGTNQMQSAAVSRPVIASGQNGPGTADVTTTFYDTYGRPTWTMDPEGFINYTAYDTGTGAVVKSIADVDTTQTSGFTNKPAGWATPAGGGLNLVTTAQVDGQGRTTKETDALGNVTYTVFDDVAHAVRTYRGWNATTGTATGPTEVTRVDYPGSYTETLTMSATPAVSGTAGSYAPTGAEAIASIQTLARALADSSGRVVEEDHYASLGGTTYSTTALRLGTAGTNYYTTYHGFDPMGRPARTLDPTGTITDTTYDALGRVASVAVGTADTYTPGPTGPSNMVQVAADQYDANGVGDGNLTQATRYPDAVAADARVMAYAYDWRDRPVATKAGVQSTEDTTTHRPITYYDLDNLGAVTAVSHFDADTVALTNARPSLSLLRAYTATSYDDQGRAYLTQTYGVDQVNGATSMATLTATTPLTTATYYDHRGDAIATAMPGGLVTKSAFDGAGRVVKQSTTDGAGGTTWANAGSVTGDHVLTQTLTTYDAAGNPILTTTKDRFDTDTSADTGDLGDRTTGPKARVSFLAGYFDAANRPTAAVNVGTNGGSAYTRPGTPPTPSDTALVTSYAYNAAGWVATVTDPRGIVTQTTYDLLRRTTQTIAGYNASINGGNPTTSANATTQYTYDGAGHVLTVTAVMPAGTPSQTTTYVYGVGSAGNLYSNDVLAATVQPDKTTGAYPSPANLPGDEKTYAYNFLGQQAGMTDENGTVHAYAYDVLGRQVSDAVTTLGTGVDGAVRRLATAYDTGDRPYLFTGYNAASGGTVVNQVQRVFNGLGQLTGEYQEHAGAVVTSTTPEVQYAYNQMAGGANNSRPTGVTYPNGHVMNYAYNAGLDDAIGRVSALVDGAGGTPGTTLEGYSYLGLDTIVRKAHPEPGVDLTYIQAGATGDGGDPYVGLDRFGRVVDRNWVKAGASLDRFQYGYDRAGNVLSRNNPVNPAFGELYHANSTASGDNATAYDPLGRLAAFARGTLSASGRNGTGLDTIASSSHGQSWALDALGNWSGVTTDGSTLTRAANAQNQTTSVSGPSGANPPTYDAAGNTTGAYASNNGTNQTYAYDAWNRLVAVKGPGGVVQATYVVDALGRRIAETYPQSVNPQVDHLYYTPRWQVIEERYAGTASANVILQYAWGPGYVDDLIEREAFTAGVRVGRNYALQDANRDVTAATDPSGAVQERYAYDPYGAVTVLSAAWAPMGGTLGWRYLFQGGRQDPASGLIDRRARDYNVAEGRWMERDPMGLAAGDANIYRFVGGDPVNFRDPEGLYVIVADAFATGTGALIGLAAQGIGDALAGKLSNWEDYVGAAVGGGVAGETSLYFGPLTGGLAGGASGNIARQVLSWITGKQNGISTYSFVQDTFISGITSKIAGPRLIGITSGRNSFNAIKLSNLTKLKNGTIRRIRPLVACKMGVGEAVRGANGTAAGSLVNALTGGGSTYDPKDKMFGYNADYDYNNPDRSIYYNSNLFKGPIGYFNPLLAPSLLNPAYPWEGRNPTIIIVDPNYGPIDVPRLPEDGLKSVR